MNLSSQVAEALVSAGAGMREVDAVVEVGPGEWVIQAGRHLLKATLPVDGSRVIFEVEVGRVPADADARIYGAFLSWSLLWRETAGGRLGLADDGTLTQIVDVPAAALLAGATADVLVDVAEKAEVWRQLVVGASSASAVDTLSYTMLRI